MGDNSVIRRASRPRIILLAAGIALLAPGGRAGAQSLSTAGEGLNAGRFVLHPSITFEFRHDDNVFRSSETAGTPPIDSGVLAATARFVVDLPLGESRVRWSYSPVYRDYTSDQFRQSERFSHFFDLEGDFRIGPSLRLEMRDHLVRGTVELQEIDPGGELTFGLVPFTTHEPQMELTVGMAGRFGASLLPRYASVSFEQVEEAPLFGSRTRGLEGRFKYRVGEPSTLYASYTYDSTDLEGLSATGSVSRKIGIGLERVVNQAVVATFSAGYQSIEFEGGGGRRFTGPVMEANARWLLGDATTLEFGLGRQPYQSYSLDRNYYVNTQFRLRMTQQIGRNVYWETGVTFHGNVYADPGEPGTERRRDRTWRLEVGAGYQFLRTLRAFVGYTFDDRQSNLGTGSPGLTTGALDYRAKQVVLRIQAGWL